MIGVGGAAYAVGISWDDLIGQPEAVATLQAAAAGDGLTHSWLLTGPPGSGRSVLAFAFAAALIARPGDEPATDAQVAARTHPDLAVLSTEGVTILRQDVKDFVTASYFAPSIGSNTVVLCNTFDQSSCLCWCSQGMSRKTFIWRWN